MPADRSVVVLAALDTKASEVAYLAARIEACGCPARIVDIGLRRPDLPLDKLAAMDEVARTTRDALSADIAAHRIAGVAAIGGGVGTWIAMTAMRELPFGFPKLIVSTLPFDVRAGLGGSDIVIVPAVTDLLGLNAILRGVLDGAACIVAALAAAPHAPAGGARMIGATALGVVTPAALALRTEVEASGFELACFHAAGYGGAAFETTIARGAFAGVIDLATSELTSELFGGVAPAGPDRLRTAARLGLPQIVVPGGLDFVSRGPIEQLSAADRARAHVRHSPMFTHVRIDADGMRRVARELATRVAGSGHTVVAVPAGGFSAENRPGGALYDADADRTFVNELAACAPSNVRIIEIEAHINDPVFARRVWELLAPLLREA